MLSEALSIGGSRGHLDYPKIERFYGLENPSETFSNIVRWLIAHGYSDEDIAKAVGGNVMRVLKQVWVR
jgi:membrane dipeptidase